MQRPPAQPNQAPVAVVTPGARLLCTLLGVLVAGVANAANDEEAMGVDAAAVAEVTRPSSRIEIGVGGISDSSFAAGNYSGLKHKGGYAIGNFDLRGSQYSYGNDNDDKTRWRLSGSNLGLGSRSLSGEYGQQGAYRATFGYDETPRLYSDSYQTPFLGAASANLVLPAGFVGGPDTGAMATLGSSMRRFDVQATRVRSELGLSYTIAADWELRLNFRNDERDGTKIRGAEFGSNGGNARAALLPEPIDSSTHLIDASLAFSGESHRFRVSYHGSIFRNHIGSLTWQNPYSSAPWVGGPSGLPANFPLPSGRLGVAPDNQFHQLSATGAYDFSNTTRLTMSASRGRMTQDEAFLPYTINAGLASTALPRNSLDGLVETTLVNARLSMRPLRNLWVNASLRYDSRDNRTPQAEYIYIGGDIQLQPPPGSNTDRIRTNLPRSRRQQLITLDADYRLSDSTAVKAGWDHEKIKRSFAEVERASEDTYRIELREGGAGAWSANASYAWLARRGTQYLHNVSYLASYSSPAFVQALVAANGCTVLIECVRNGPLQNKFYLADRDRERTRLMLGFAPDAPFSVQAHLDLNRDHYPHSPYGVSEASSWSVGADLAYVFSENFNATLFYSFEDQRSRERARQNASPNPAVPTSAASDWINQFVDRTASLGMGVKYKGLLGGRLELNADALAVRGHSPISTTVGPGVSAAQNPALPFPDLVMRSASLNLGARYAIDSHTSVGLSYSYRRLRSADWAYEQVGLATIPSLIGTNEAPPRYAVHGLGVSYIHTFR